MPEETPTFLLTDVFRKQKAVTEISRVYGDVWDGWQQNYELDGKFWYAIVARNKKTAVLLTIMGEKKNQHLLHDTYIRILKSLKVGEGVNAER